VFEGGGIKRYGDVHRFSILWVSRAVKGAGPAQCVIINLISALPKAKPRVSPINKVGET
jgi:hypothetical protein